MSLDVSRTTVAAAYDALRDAAVLHSRRGAGSWTQLPADPAGGADVAPFSPQADRTLLDLAHAALPAPGAELRRAAAAAVHDLDALLGGHGYDLLGLPALRAAIADRYTARGLPTTPDQVLVTVGRPAGDRAGRRRAGRAGRPGAGRAPDLPQRARRDHAPRRAAACRCRWGRDPDGTGAWDLDLLTAAVRDAAPRLAYLIPDHQNPTGAVLDAAGRERLVELARRTGTPLLVDETLAELTLRRHPAGARGRPRRGRLPAGDHRRVGQQGVLGRAARRLDPHGGADGAPARRPARPRSTSAARCWSSSSPPG